MNRVPHSPIGRLLARHATRSIMDGLTDTRVVLLNGARQGGKSTLASQLGREYEAVWRSLDNAVTRQAAHHDPTTFVQEDTLLVIDEIQRVPELLLSIKETVDADPRPGRFLLTGSARVLGLRTLPDALPGRMETIELWPLSQGEIDDQPDGFVDATFSEGPALKHRTDQTRDDYLSRIVRGGFPEAVARTGRRRAAFFDNYIADLVNRDVMQLSQIHRGTEMRALIHLLAARSGQLLVPANLADALNLPQSTITHYITLLEEMFLVKRIPAWAGSVSSRAIRTPKIAFVDSGIAANLLDEDEKSLRRIETQTLGGLLEGFVGMEIARQLSWCDTRANMFHYRTKDKVEVDIVLENRRGQVVAIDVKASATVRTEDFAGINHLAARLGDKLLVGLVLYTGHDTLSFGPKTRAMPISALWEAATSVTLDHG